MSILCNPLGVIPVEDHDLIPCDDNGPVDGEVKVTSDSHFRELDLWEVFPYNFVVLVDYFGLETEGT